MSRNRADLVGLVVEDVLGEVVGDVAVVVGERRHEALDVGPARGATGPRAGGRRPSPRSGQQGVDLPGQVAAGGRPPQSGGRLVGVEGEVLLADLDETRRRAAAGSTAGAGPSACRRPRAAPAGPARRAWPARRPGTGCSARGGRRGPTCGVASPWSSSRSDGQEGLPELVVAHAHPRQEPGGERRRPPPEGAAQIGGQAPGPVVLRHDGEPAHPVPGLVGRPLRQQGRLAVAGRGHHRGQPLQRGQVEQVEQALPAHGDAGGAGGPERGPRRSSRTAVFHRPVDRAR